MEHVSWIEKPQTDLEAAIAEFKAALPGWWYSVCECQVSCDASCAPTRDSDDLALIEIDRVFDTGFHADLLQPSTLAEALRDVMRQALEAKARFSDSTADFSREGLQTAPSPVKPAHGPEIGLSGDV